MFSELICGQVFVGIFIEKNHRHPIKLKRCIRFADLIISIDFLNEAPASFYIYEVSYSHAFPW